MRALFQKCGPPLAIAVLLAGILLPSGCSSPSRQPVAAPAPVPRPSLAPAIARPLSLLVAPQPTAQQPAPPPPVQAEQPHVRETPSSSVRKLLPKTCVVMEVSPTMVLVLSGTPTPSPSLFEEAIALSKLRGLLTARPAIPKDTAQKTKLQNGTATIPFGKSVPPADVASAVAAALSVDGVQRVRAVMGAD